MEKVCSTMSRLADSWVRLGELQKNMQIVPGLVALEILSHPLYFCVSDTGGLSVFSGSWDWSEVCFPPLTQTEPKSWWAGRRLFISDQTASIGSYIRSLFTIFRLSTSWQRQKMPHHILNYSLNFSLIRQSRYSSRPWPYGLISRPGK